MIDELDSRVRDLERLVGEIQGRNEKVERDKAWETSFARRLAVLLVTYLTTAAVFSGIGVEHYFLNALIPTLGYFLSTLALPFLRQIWERFV